jgi:kumamolisin
MVYNFNEAIGRGEVDVITDSFAHREDSEPRAVREQYDHAATMAAALGITVSAATGDSSETDTPSSSPYVTGVGGTVLSLNAGGDVTNEVAWPGSGSGPTLSFPIPWWQQGVVTNSGGKRAVADVALNASPQSAYWVYYLADWHLYGGTSFSSPAFTGIVAVINSYRMAQGLPRVGWLNSILYTDPSVKAAFRDITSGQTPYFAAGPGWDYPTGWGVPRALDLAMALP